MARQRFSSSDVAREAGVSRTTVSYVLNGQHLTRIPETTRERVLEAARKLDYRSNTLARGLKSGRTTLVGVFTRFREENFQERIIQGIHEACYERGHSVIIAGFERGQPIEQESILRMMDFNVCGIIRVVGALSESERLLFSNAQDHDDIPVVLVDDTSSSDLFDSVVSDDKAGAKAVVDHLVSLGHRRIAHLSGGTDTSSSRDRFAGYRASLAEAGIEFDPTMVAGKSYESGDAMNAATTLLNLQVLPTAVFCGNDIAASLTREVARQRGMHVPDDIAVAGYGDTELGMYSGITSVDQHPEQLGEMAVDCLFERMVDPTKRPKINTGEIRLIVRPSTIGGALVLPLQ